MPRIKRDSSAKGFTLPLILIAMAALLTLAVSSLCLTYNARKGVDARAGAYHLELALTSAQEDAIALLSFATNRDSFITHQQQNETGDPEYYLVSWFEEGDWTHQPLYSGASVQKTGHLGQLDRYTPPLIATKEGELMEILDLGNNADGSKLSFETSAVALDESLIYGYWIEDLGGRLDYEALTYDGDSISYESSITDSTGSPLLTTQEASARAQLRILEQRHIGSNIFREESNGEYPINYSDPLGKRLINPNSPSQPSPPPHLFADLLAKQATPYALTPSIVASEVSSPQIERYINVRRPECLELDLIPHGHDYPLAGQQLKANLNNWIQQAETAPHQIVKELAEWIKQVPGFKDSSAEYNAIGLSGDGVNQTRYGGLRASESYTKTLAANIIDYADLNSNSTSIRPPIENTEGGVVADTSRQYYRGIDAMPLLSEVARRYELIANLGENADGRFSSVVEVRTFIELRNPTNLPIQGYIKYVFNPHWTHSIDLDGDGRRDTRSLAQSFPNEELYYWKGLLTLQPNEYKVIEVTNDRDGDFQGEDARAGGSSTYEVETTTNVGYLQRASSQWRNECSLYWMASSSGSLQAKHFIPICGFHTPFDIKRGTIKPPGNAANYSAIAGPLRNANYIMTGDLRNTIYTSLPTSATAGHTAHSFASTASFGGANLVQRSTADWMENPEAKFPDGAYNQRFLGKNPSGSGAYSPLLPGEQGYVTTSEELTSQSPTQPYEQQTLEDQSRYLQHISNQGFYTSIGELGNIYDPAQWRELKRQTTHASKLPLNEETVASSYPITVTSSYGDYGQDQPQSELNNFGGGATLAIGSPEFNAYDPAVDSDRVGYEAARLVDIFRVKSSPFTSSKAKVNLNTAPKKVIESLFAGFTHEEDKVSLKGAGFTRQPQARESETVASGWSQGIIEHRARQPYLGLSDIALTKASLLIGQELHLMYLFGEKALYESNATDASLDLTSFVWNDQGREECFRRLNELFTTKSRSYRLHLQAEYTQNGRIKRVQKKIDLTLRPQRKTNLRVDSDKPPQIFFH